MSPPYNMIAVVGATASGKTALAARLADRLGGEVISADSRQVYRHMNLGTGKDYGDYQVSGRKVPYHLIDIADPGHHYSVFEFQQDFNRVYSNLISRKRLPILCGGSGLYIQAVTRCYDLPYVPFNTALRGTLESLTLGELSQKLMQLKKLHNTTDTDTRERAIRAIEIATHRIDNPLPSEQKHAPVTLFIGIRFDRDTQRKRITERLYARLKQGMVSEVQGLLDSGMNPEKLMYYGLEYKYITLYLTGKLTYTDMASHLETAIHQFAKRQMTWFRKMEREGTVINWLDGQLGLEEKTHIATELYRATASPDT